MVTADCCAGWWRTQRAAWRAPFFSGDMSLWLPPDALRLDGDGAPAGGRPAGPPAPPPSPARPPPGASSPRSSSMACGSPPSPPACSPPPAPACCCWAAAEGGGSAVLQPLVAPVLPMAVAMSG